VKHGSGAINIALLGFGNVGRAFCNYLIDPERSARIPIRIAAVADSSGWVLVQSPSHLDSLLAHKVTGGRIKQFAGNETRDPDTFITDLRAANVPILVESLPTSLTDGQPALELIARALSAGIHVVTVDKGPLVHGFERLYHVARTGGSTLAFSGTTGVRAPDELTGETVTEIRGILNGTSNYILSEMQQRGQTFDSALAAARAAGIAEPNPSLDVDGWDTAFKILILAKSLMKASTRLDEVSRIGIGAETETLIAAASATGRRTRLVGRARIWQSLIRVSVAPKLVGPESPFFGIEGTSKAVVFTVNGDRDVLVHARSGRDAISETILDDVIRVSANL
jgi:homoserine dehydrogenase